MGPKTRTKRGRDHQQQHVQPPPHHKQNEHQLGKSPGRRQKAGSAQGRQNEVASEAAQLARIRARAEAQDSSSSEGEYFSDDHGDDLARGDAEDLARVRARAEAEDGSVDDDSGSGEDQHSGGSGSENESEAGDSSSSDDAPFAPGDAYDDSDYDSENGLHEANASGDRIAELPLAERLQREQYGAGPKQHRRPVVTGLDARDRSALKTRMAAAQAKAKGKSAFQLADIDGSGSGSDGEGEGETDRRHGNSTAGGGGGGGGGGEKSAIPKRANKNQPMEMSSKRAVGRHREVVEVRRRRARDPRFDAATGTLNYDMFRKSYEFLEGYQDGEIDALRKEAAKAKKRRGDGSAERAAAAKALLTKMQQERAERKRADATRAALSQRRKAEAEAVAKGKAPYFMKARDRRALALETRYEELRREGKVQKFVQKKRKRNAAKDRRWMPAKRQNTGGGGGDGGGP